MVAAALGAGRVFGACHGGGRGRVGDKGSGRATALDCRWRYNSGTQEASLLSALRNCRCKSALHHHASAVVAVPDILGTAVAAACVTVQQREAGADAIVLAAFRLVAHRLYTLARIHTNAAHMLLSTIGNTPIAARQGMATFVTCSKFCVFS